MRIENRDNGYPAIDKAMQIMRARLNIPLEAERKSNKQTSTEVVYVDDANVGVDCIIVESLSNSLKISTSGSFKTCETNNEVLNSSTAVPLHLIVDVKKFEHTAEVTEMHSDVRNANKTVILVDSSVDFSMTGESAVAYKEPEDSHSCFNQPTPVPSVNLPLLPRKRRYVLAEKLARRDLNSIRDDIKLV